MNARIVGAGLLAGLVVFAWGSLSHMVLGLGEAGVTRLPHEAPVLEAIGQNVSARGLYFFPFEEDWVKWEEAYRTRPHGVMVVTPAGDELAFGRRLGIELTTNIVCGLLAALLFAAAPAAFGTWKAGAVAGAALGAFASVAIDASYWNWYDFPSLYLLAQTTDQVVAWTLAGAVIGWRLGKR